MITTLERPMTQPEAPPTPQRADALAALREAAREATAAQVTLREHVGAARAAGATWQQVADLFGITRQSAAERFGRAS